MKISSGPISSDCVVAEGNAGSYRLPQTEAFITSNDPGKCKDWSRESLKERCWPEVRGLGEVVVEVACRFESEEFEDVCGARVGVGLDCNGCGGWLIKSSVYGSSAK